MMGVGGEILVVIMLLMAILSTGSAEVIAVTSIIVYDIYMLYIKVILEFETASWLNLCSVFMDIVLQLEVELLDLANFPIGSCQGFRNW